MIHTSPVTARSATLSRDSPPDAARPRLKNSTLRRLTALTVSTLHSAHAQTPHRRTAPERSGQLAPPAGGRLPLVNARAQGNGTQARHRNSHQGRRSESLKAFWLSQRGGGLVPAAMRHGRSGRSACASRAIRIARSAARDQQHDQQRAISRAPSGAGGTAHGSDRGRTRGRCRVPRRRSATRRSARRGSTLASSARKARNCSS